MVSTYVSPFSEIPLHQPTLEALRETGLFLEADKDSDEDEYSIEMQLGLLVYALRH